MLTLSYIPLFYAQYPVVEPTTKREKRRLVDDILKFIREAERKQLGKAKACLWMWDSDDTKQRPPRNPRPVLVMDYGRDVLKHAIWWSQDHPEKFFEFSFFRDPSGWYSCAVMPNLRQSSTRMQFNMREVGYQPEQANQIIFIPLSFYTRESKTMEKFFGEGGSLPGTISVGILDSALFDATKIEVGKSPYDPNDIGWLENIPVVTDGVEYLKAMHTDEAQPMSQTIKPGMWFMNPDGSVTPSK